MENPHDKKGHRPKTTYTCPQCQFLIFLFFLELSHFAPVGVPSIAISVSVSVFVCLSASQGRIYFLSVYRYFCAYPFLLFSLPLFLFSPVCCCSVL